MRKLKLNNGAIALVDSADYLRVSKYSWSAWKHRYTQYAVREAKIRGKRVVIYLHRFITGWSGLIDHKNQNGLDNRRSNLRKADGSQNQQNRKLNANSTTGYKGVCFDKRSKRYLASICVYKKQKTLGRFKDKKVAALAYDLAALLHFGPFSRTNFPKV